MTIVLPKQLPAQLSDIFLNIDFLGNSATISREGRLLNDQLFNDQPWMVGIMRSINPEAAQFLQLKIQPWQYEFQGVPKKLVDKMKKTDPPINGVKVLPQYKTLVEQ